MPLDQIKSEVPVSGLRYFLNDKIAGISNLRLSSKLVTTVKEVSKSLIWNEKNVW